MAGELFQRLPGILGTHHLHQFDLLELVLAYQAAGIAAVGTRLGTKTGRVSDIAQRKLPGIDDAIAHKIGYRYLGGGYQVHRATVVINTEQILLELGQLPGAVETVGIHQVGHIGLGIAVVLAVLGQHELDQCAVQPCDAAGQGHEAGAGEFCRTFEIHAPVQLAEIDMIAHLKIENGRFAPGFDQLVVVLAVALGHRVVRQVGGGQQHLVDLRLQGLEFLLCDLEFVAEGSHAIEQRLDVLALGLGLADGFRRGVAFVLQLLGAHLQLLASRIQFEEALLVEFEVLASQAFDHLVDIAAQQPGI